MLNSRQKGCRFEPHRLHCIVSLSKTHYSLLSTGSTQEDPSRHNWKIVDCDVKNQIKQTKLKLFNNMKHVAMPLVREHNEYIGLCYIQCSPFIMLCLGFHRNWPCYKWIPILRGTLLQTNYGKMPILWSFSYNSFVKFHEPQHSDPVISQSM